MVSDDGWIVMSQECDVATTEILELPVRPVRYTKYKICSGGLNKFSSTVGFGKVRKASDGWMPMVSK